MCVADEDVILNMSYDWFREVIEVLGEFVNFDAVVNYGGNAFCEKSWDMIMDNNPVLKGQILTAEERSWQNFFATAKYKTIKHGGQADGNKENNGTRAGGHGGQQDSVREES